MTQDINTFYNMEFNHNYANGKLSFFEETLENGEISYWINAMEQMKKLEHDSFVAVKFNKEQLINLRNALNDLNLR